jgi:hypothetical protein
MILGKKWKKNKDRDLAYLGFLRESDSLGFLR